MATVLFASMVPEVSAFLPGCPNVVVEMTARKMAIDLCQRSKVWSAELPAITLVPGTVGYAPVSPFAYAEFTDFVSGTTTIDGSIRSLEWSPLSAVQRAYPSWPTDAAGTPQYITSDAPYALKLAPVPDTAGTATIRAHLRPTRDATQWDSDLYSEFSRVLFHGTLGELMAMPGRSWSNTALATYHAKTWTNLVREARDRAMRGFNVSDLGAQMRPFA